MNFRWQGWIVCLAIAVTGCEISTPQADAAKKKNAEAKKRAERQREVAYARAQQQKELEQQARTELSNVERAYRETQSTIRNGSSGSPSRSGGYSAGSSSSSLGSYRGDAQGPRTILKQIDEAVELNPTLVVWLIDTSASAARVTTELRSEALSYYAGETLEKRLAENPEQLTTAVVGFAEATQFELETPAADPAAVKGAFDKLTSGSEGKENTFAALKAAVEKYAPLRQTQRRQLIFVLATDEAGDDPAVADEVVPLLRKSEIPVYVLGVNAPWGSANPTAAKDKKADAAKFVYGPESVASERVIIQFTMRGFSSSPVGEMVDSGFGPHGLERIARAGGGAFFASRVSGGGAWPPGNELRFDPAVMKKYAPDYVSASEYQKLLSQNKCRLALHEAAKLPPAEVLTSPTSSFVKQANETRMKQAITAAQRLAAHVGPELDKLFDTLAIGEGDRSKLTGARWQASYDLAYGRAMAAKVRADGYNAMLAVLQRGKNFENASSNTWSLEPADSIDAGSAYQKMIDKAKEYLQRVVTEHPGTPWAKEAEEELKTPMGWKLRES